MKEEIFTAEKALLTASVARNLAREKCRIQELKLLDEVPLRLNNILKEVKLAAQRGDCFIIVSSHEIFSSYMPEKSAHNLLEQKLVELGYKVSQNNLGRGYRISWKKEEKKIEKSFWRKIISQ